MRKLTSSFRNDWLRRTATRGLIGLFPALLLGQVAFSDTISAQWGGGRRGGGGTVGSTVSKTVSVNGVARSYLVYRPSTYSPSAAAPVVLVLHGQNQTGQQIATITRFNQEAEGGRFLAVYPTSPNSWNGPDEVTFISRIVDALAAEYTIDARRVYAAGLSSGGIMAYRLACGLAGRIAAVSAVSAIDFTESCGPSRPISVLHIHGTGDTTFPYGGADFLPSVPSVIAAWRQRDGCTGSPTVTVTAVNGTPVTKDAHTACNQNSEVTLYTIQGGTHTWFGAQLSGPNAAVKATPVSWQFFRARPMP